MRCGVARTGALRERGWVKANVAGLAPPACSRPSRRRPTVLRPCREPRTSDQARTHARRRSLRRCCTRRRSRSCDHRRRPATCSRDLRGKAARSRTTQIRHRADDGQSSSAPHSTHVRFAGSQTSPGHIRDDVQLVAVMQVPATQVVPAAHSLAWAHDGGIAASVSMVESAHPAAASAIVTIGAQVTRLM